jgi:hypothetical protein
MSAKRTATPTQGIYVENDGECSAQTPESASTKDSGIFTIEGDKNIPNNNSYSGIDGDGAVQCE